jgi:hypothetical protein
VEIAHIDIANIPEHEWHWSAWTSRTHGSALGLVSLVPVPDLAIAINATRAMTINAYVIASQDKTSSVVLKLDVIVIATPIFEVLGEL